MLHSTRFTVAPLVAAIFLVPTVWAQGKASPQKPSSPQTRLMSGQSRPVYPGDNSDWWSRFPVKNDGKPIPELKREPSPAVQRILGINVGTDEHPLARAIAKLGPAAAVVRGDAASSREQLCYISETGKHKVHLIFERGEVYAAYYLFMDGRRWNGESLCAPSKLASAALRNEAGLGLGETRARVESILGKPSLRLSDGLFYVFWLMKKTSAADMDRIRKEYPRMGKGDLEESYGSYYLGVNIKIGFDGPRSNYLGVSWSEQY